MQGTLSLSFANKLSCMGHICTHVQGFKNIHVHLKATWIADPFSFLLIRFML